MKNLILAITVAALPVCAHAQKSYTNHAGAYDQNYKVCRVDGTYTTCDENTPSVVTSKRARTNNARVEASLRPLDQHVYVEPKEEQPAMPVAVAVTSRKNKRFSASYDDPNAAYQGKESKINDGVEKNKSRNLNYINNGANLPPNDGGNSDKR